MNRRGFLRGLMSAVPVVAAPAALAELLVPKRTIFLPPRGGWVAADVDVSLVALVKPYAESWKRTVDAVNREVARMVAVSGEVKVGMELIGPGILPGTRIIALQGWPADEPFEVGDWSAYGN